MFSRDVRAEAVVDAREHRAGLVQPLRAGAQDAPRRRHHHRGRNALVGDVADDEADAAVGEVDEVVEVAADRARRPVERGDLPAGELGQLLRQEVLLDQLRDLRAPARAGRARGSRSAARARAGRRGPPARPARRASRAAGGRPPSSPGRRGAAPDVQQADQLAVGDERDDERDARRRASRSSAGESSSRCLSSTAPEALWKYGDHRIVGRDVESRRRRARPGTAARSIAGSTTLAGAAERRGRRRTTRRIARSVIAMAPLYTDAVPEALRARATRSPCADAPSHGQLRAAARRGHRGRSARAAGR